MMAQCRGVGRGSAAARPLFIADASAGPPMPRLPALAVFRTIGFAALILLAAGLGRQGFEKPPPRRIAVEPAAFVSYAGGAETIEALFH